MFFINQNFICGSRFLIRKNPVKVIHKSVRCSTRYVVKKLPENALTPPITSDSDIRHKIIYNCILEVLQPTLSYFARSKNRKAEAKKLREEGVISPSPIFLKYLENNNETKSSSEYEDVDPEVNRHVHFPYKVEQSVVQASPETPIEEDTGHETIVERVKWENELKDMSIKRLEQPESWKRSRPPEPLIDESECEEGHQIMYGTPNPSVPVSSIPCGGCGSLLHCQDAAIPGYIPSEIFCISENEELRSIVCQRCHFLKYFNTALKVNVKPEDYPLILSGIKQKQALIIFMVDLLDFPCSIWPEIVKFVGRDKPFVIVGNKVDLLFRDGDHFVQRVKESLMVSLVNSGLPENNIKHVALVSAKTGYGVENLITVIFQHWSRGDVYIVGCTNSGKSTLFNTLIKSDYCKEKATDLVQRATTSVWPGTTLNLLKFPITRASREWIVTRKNRLEAERPAEKEEKLIFDRSRGIDQASLLGYMGKTRTTGHSLESSGDPFTEKLSPNQKGSELPGINPSLPHFIDSRWCYDTPGVLNKDQILTLLTTNELNQTLPKNMMIPMNIHAKRGMTVFLGGLARIDYTSGPDLIWLSVFASEQIPITVTKTGDADEVYERLLGSDLFVVPNAGDERLAEWPALQSKDLKVTGKGMKEAAADIVLSSAGWITVTANQAYACMLRAWTPEGRGIFLRKPSIFKDVTSFRNRSALTKSPVFERQQISIDAKFTRVW